MFDLPHSSCRARRSTIPLDRTTSIRSVYPVSLPPLKCSRMGLEGTGGLHQRGCTTSRTGSPRGVSTRLSCSQNGTLCRWPSVISGFERPDSPTSSGFRTCAVFEYHAICGKIRWIRKVPTRYTGPLQPEYTPTKRHPHEVSPGARTIG